MTRRRALPAPIREEVEMTLTGRVYGIWGADNFEFGDYLELHYILVQGIQAPAPGEPFFHQAKRASANLIRDRRVIIKVKQRDEMMREIAEVYVPFVKGIPEGKSLDGPQDPVPGEYFDLGLKLIEAGWARYNGSPSEFAKAYQDAENHARTQKIGIWQNRE